MKSERVIFLDSLRVIAIIAVIILHSAASQWYITPVNSLNWQILNIYNSLVRWCVPMFLMISGVFFLDPNKNISKKDIFYKYIKRILIALIFWGLLYGLINLFIKSFINHEKIVSYNFIEIFLKIVFGPPWYHLWFLYLIIGLYILTPIFRIFILNSKKEDIEYLLILFFIFGLFLPTIKYILIAINTKYNINFSIIELTGYAGYFFAGYYFYKYEVNRIFKYLIYLFGITSLIFTIIVTSKLSQLHGKPNEYFYGYLLPTTMFETYSIFLVLKDIFNSYQFSEKINKNIIFLSNCSFGIYLIHDFINQAYSIIGLKTTSFNPIIMVPIMSFVNLIISLIIISIIRKIPLISKYLT